MGWVLNRTGDSDLPHRRRPPHLSVFLPVLAVAAMFLALDFVSPGFAADHASFDGKAPRVWADRLTAKNRNTRFETMHALVSGGKEALPVLAALLRSADKDVRKRADQVLGRIGPVAIPTLIAVVRGSNANARFHAASVLGDLAPESVTAVKDLRRLLGDRDYDVAVEAAWALASLRELASPAVGDLSRALSHPCTELRLMSAGALASIGPKSRPATRALARTLTDPDPSVRRSAAEALAAIGPDAAQAVPQLIAALKDRTLYVRICAASALGSIGKAARDSAPALRAAAAEAGLRGEAAWALTRITGEALPPLPKPPTHISTNNSIATSATPGKWHMLGGSPARNAVSSEQNLPESWDINTGRNIQWWADLGRETYGSPIVVDGIVYIGTDNAHPKNPDMTEECGVLMAFRAKGGKFLWQDVARKLGRGLDEFLLPTTCSAPLVEGERLYYVTAQCQLRCLDTKGFQDGENDGPLRDEADTRKWSADVIWELDMGGALGVFPHEATNCSVVSIGDLLMVCTSNGVNEAHTKLPAPRAPSFLGVNKKTGDVVWRSIGPGDKTLHGQWSCPAALTVNGRPLALFGGGDGWLYALKPSTGRQVWRYDGNPKNAVWRPTSDRKGVVSRNAIIANPLVHNGRVYLAMGQDPEHGEGKGRLHAIDPGGSGDVTTERRIWVNEDVGRAVGTPIIHDGLLYLGDLNGWVHCIDISTGRKVWDHNLRSAVWGTMLVADGKLYVGDEGGVMSIFRTGRSKKMVAQIEFDAPLWSAPAVVDGTLYVATANRLYAISKRKK